MSKPIVLAEGLSKSFRVADKQPGLAGTLRHALRRRYRDVEAVRDLSFAIQPGEVVGFLGPNGAGKTTTLKMLSGLIHPSGGRVQVAGCQPQRRQERFLQQITLVMGNRQQLIWDLPPLDSLRVNAAVYGIEPIAAKRRIAELADMLELGEELHRPVRKLSLGQRMKAELLAALLHEPAVLFLDEPTLGLDVNAQARVRDFLADINRRTGTTVLLTSHYMADIQELCDRVIIIDEKGQIADGDQFMALLAARWADAGRHFENALARQRDSAEAHCGWALAPQSTHLSLPGFARISACSAGSICVIAAAPRRL